LFEIVQVKVPRSFSCLPSCFPNKLNQKLIIKCLYFKFIFHSKHYLNYVKEDILSGPGMLTYVCNHTYLGDRDHEDCSSRPALAKK
jgi:hypothetical protein